MAEVEFLDSIPVGRIFLLHSNPRHEPFETEGEAIAYLCEKEDVYPLARDIVKHGLSPLERCGIFPADKKPSGGSYFVAEGNRRICALKLLNDPELAPANLRKGFAKLAQNWTPIKSVSAAKFEDYNSIRIWLDRTHNGPQGGIGRRPWNTEQKTRFDGGNRQKAAQALLDYAEQEKMISPEERKGKLSTVHRFVTKDVFSETLGLDASNPDELARTRPKAEFDTILRRFMRDLIGKKEVTSRMNKPQINAYARPLASLSGVTTARVSPEALGAEGPSEPAKPKTRRKKPGKPEKARHVQYEEDIFQALRSYGNGKLESLYHSICTVELDPHTPLVSIGAWAFFESLTACAGRKDGTPFANFLPKSKLTAYGISGRTTALTEAINRIGGYGNTNKHHPVAATFNGDQLNNDMITLKEVILAVIAEAKAQTK
jgi:hypothetical protein